MNLLILILFVVILKETETKGYDQKIREYLMQQYNPTSFPSNGQVEVQASFSISGLLKIDEIDNIVSMSAILRIKWVDDRLKWDPSLYGDLRNITFDMNFEKTSIWTPDVVVQEQEGKFTLDTLDRDLIQVYNNGQVYWSRPGSITFLHTFRLKNYPFNNEYLKFRLTSWMHQDQEVKLTPWIKQPGRSRTPFTYESSFQQYLNYDLHLNGYNQFVYKAKSGDYTEIHFYLRMEKQSLMIFNIVIIPAFMIQVLGLLTFMIPRDSPLRIVFSGTILLTVIMFLLIVARIVPNNSENPLIEKLFFQFVLLQFMFVFYVLVQRGYSQVYQNIQDRGKKKPYKYSKVQQKINYLFRQINESDYSYEQIGEASNQYILKLDQEIYKEFESNNNKPFILKKQILNPIKIDKIGYFLFVILQIVFIIGVSSQLVNREQQ